MKIEHTIQDQRPDSEKAPSAPTFEAFEEKSYSYLPTDFNTASASNDKPRKLKSSAKSSALTAQYDTILANLKPCGKTMTTIALRRLGVMQPAARIKELREKLGYPLERVGRITVYDDWGFAHLGVALYALVCPGDEVAPAGQQAPA